MHPFTLTLLLAGLAMLGPFSTDTYLPSFPAIAGRFSVDPLLMQQTLSIYLLAHALTALFYGTLSDSLGRRRVVLGSLLLFVIGSVGAACAHSFGMLLFFRATQGLASGAGMVIAQAVIRDRFSGAVAQRMMSNLMMLFGFAPAIAPIVGGLLQVSFGWQAVFLFLAAVGAFLLVSCFVMLEESLPVASRQPFRVAPIAANYWRALGNPVFMCRALSFGLAFGGLALYISGAPDFVINVLHLSATSFAWLFVPMITGLVLGSALCGKLAHRITPDAMTWYGFLAMGVAALGNIALCSFLDVAVWWAVSAVMIYHFGLSLAMPAMGMQALDIYPTMRGLAASLLNFVMMLIFSLVSGFIAPALFGSALKMGLGLAAFLCLSILFWMLGSARLRMAAARPLA
ncbi:MAG: Bcr/CflA family drug resistance efflux transporter [Herbaspirillum sp.]|nr:Bcr/CflA family drug resistance efflux transporter [Herbaspirillum sp.]